jgi:hypothetical protein
MRVTIILEPHNPYVPNPYQPRGDNTCGSFRLVICKPFGVLPIEPDRLTLVLWRVLSPVVPIGFTPHEWNADHRGFRIRLLRFCLTK